MGAEAQTLWSLLASCIRLFLSPPVEGADGCLCSFILADDLWGLLVLLPLGQLKLVVAEGRCCWLLSQGLSPGSAVQASLLRLSLALFEKGDKTG